MISNFFKDLCRKCLCSIETVFEQNYVRIVLLRQSLNEYEAKSDLKACADYAKKLEVWNEASAVDHEFGVRPAILCHSRA